MLDLKATSIDELKKWDGVLTECLDDKWAAAVVGGDCSAACAACVKVGKDCSACPLSDSTEDPRDNCDQGGRMRALCCGGRFKDWYGNRTPTNALPVYNFIAHKREEIRIELALRGKEEPALKRCHTCANWTGLNCNGSKSCFNHSGWEPIPKAKPKKEEHAGSNLSTVVWRETSRALGAHEKSMGNAILRTMLHMCHEKPEIAAQEIRELLGEE